MCGADKNCACSAKAKAQASLKAGAHPEPSQEYRDALQSVVAALAEGVDLSELPSEWHCCAIVEGLRTTDHRAIARGVGDFRQLPLPLFAQFYNAGHWDSAVVGSITKIEMDGDYVMASGTFDLTLEEGQQAALMCKNQTLRWVSADIEVLESQYVEVMTGDPDPLDILFGDEIGVGVVTDWYEEVLQYRIMGVTMIATPAFPQCVIAPADVALDIPEPMGTAPQVSTGLMASAIDAPVTPPASWFCDPELSEPTPLTITDDGRVFGHLALWGKCHTGYTNDCVVAPHSEKNYAYFLTGGLRTADGTNVSVGQITFDTGHASSTANWSDAVRHYDHTGTAAADVTAGEDDFGVWVAGGLRPGLTEEQVRAIRAAPLSGDWRKLDGHLELVAALAVNVPGFPIVAAGKVRDEQVSLIASSPARRDPLAELAREVATLKKVVAPLRTLAIQRLQGRVGELHTMSNEDRLAAVAALAVRVNAAA